MVIIYHHPEKKDIFAVEMQGWPSREEKGFSLEQYRETQHVFVYGEEGVDSIGCWLIPPTDDTASRLAE